MANLLATLRPPLATAVLVERAERVAPAALEAPVAVTLAAVEPAGPAVAIQVAVALVALAALAAAVAAPLLQAR